MATQIQIDDKISKSFIKDVLICIGASFLLALFTEVKFFLPFSPVPVALQPHIVLAMALFMKKEHAMISILSWLGYGLMGLPVFSGGIFGMAALMGPTAGYLLGYIAAASLMNWLKENTRLHASTLLLLGNGVIYSLGIFHLAGFVGWINAILIGALPFIIGDLIKIYCITKVHQYFKA